MAKIIQKKSTHVLTDYEEDRYMHIEWKSIVTGKQMKKILEKIYKFYKKNGYSRMLTDMTNMGVLEPEFQEWFLNDWYPRMIQIGCLYYASLTSASAAAAMAVDLADEKAEEIRQADGNAQSLFFVDIEKARTWLINQ
ncbi:MAG: hypothetical protein JW891_00555 [Candidatus Lokiarchaeota archaeon]|nr:hypothetical protein [Candidatus Lokiarchaeota archaeon]